MRCMYEKQACGLTVTVMHLDIRAVTVCTLSIPEFFIWGCPGAPQQVPGRGETMVWLETMQPLGPLDACTPGHLHNYLPANCDTKSPVFCRNPSVVTLDDSGDSSRLFNIQSGG